MLEITNNSHLHSHHKAMQGNVSKETHFRVRMVSEAFQSKPQIARHRLVHSLLKDELQGGVHALELKTSTPGEESRKAQ